MMTDSAAVSRLPAWHRVRPWSAYLVLGMLAIVVGALVPAVGAITGIAIVAVTLGAVWFGIRRHRPTSARPWLLLATGLLCSFVAATIAGFLGGRPPFPSVVDAFDMGLYVLGGLALLTWAKPAPGRSRWEGAVDAGVITAAAVVLSWTVVIDPTLRIDGLTAVELVGALTYPIIDLLVLSLAARTVFFVGMRSTASRLMVLALASLLTADSLMFVMRAHGFTEPDHPLVIMGWGATAVMVGAAALHPSMAEAGRYADASGAEVSRGRIRMYLVLTFVIPTLTLGTALSGDGKAAVAARLIVPLLASAAMSCLLLIRLNQLAQTMHRRTVALGEALTEQKVLQEELRHLALHDPLTGLGNRALLRDRMAEALDAQAPPGVHGLMLLDLDGFKHINDTLGHPVGDDLLLEVARRLQAMTTGSATLVRLGGDEFAILITNTTDGHVLAVANTVLDATRAPYLLDGHSRVLTTSIGVRLIGGPSTPTDVMRHADLALYAAKGAGKNQIAVYNKSMQDAEPPLPVRVSAIS